MKTPFALTMIMFLLSASIASAMDARREQPQEQSQAAAVPKVRVAVQYPGGSSEIRELPGGGYRHVPVDAPPRQAESPSVVTIDEFPVTDADAKTEEIKAAPEVLATLYGNAITREDVMQELWERRGKETFEWMVGRDLLKRELRRNNLEIKDSEVEERLRGHLENLRQAFPGLSRPDDLTRAASGMPLDEYRDRSVWVELALRKIMRVAMKPDEEKLRICYANMQAEFIRPERVRISQIFIPPQPPPESEGIAGPEDWARAERQMQEAHTRLRMGDEFAEVARAYGTGGQLSRWVERGELLRELEESAFSIGAGSITTPIKTGMGYHAILVEEKQERKVPPFEEVREEVQARFEEEQFVRLAGEFMARLKRNALKNGGLVVTESSDAFASREP